MEWKHACVLVILSAILRSLEAADAMRLLAAGFLSVMDDCKKDLNIDEGLITDLYKYWKQDFSFLHRETGCAIICMSKKLDLLSEDRTIHHGNTKDFAMKNGASDDLASKMIGVIHSCETKSEGIEDECWRVLEVAKCFRVGIHALHWEPTADVMLTEVLTEI